MASRIDTGVNPAGPVATPASVVPTADSRQDDFQRSVQRIMGQQLQGDILSRLNDGSFLVKIAGTAARMMLPAGTEVGDSLPMTLVSTGPRPTFLLGTDASGVTARLAAQQDEAAATVSGKAATILETLSTALPTATGNATLSNAGRLINQLLYSAQQGGAAAAVLGKAPLVNSPTTGAEQIASALQNSVTTSGVFYESHVVDWADGNRTLSDLMKEPQSQSTLLSANAGKADLVAGLQPDLAQIVNLQLNTLENQRLQWQGEIWPGQPMGWEISKDAPDKGSQDNATEEKQAWQSAVRFSLPSLGTVSASIHLIGERVQIHIRTSTEQTATSLRTHAGELADALGAAGTTLESLSVKQDERA